MLEEVKAIFKGLVATLHGGIDDSGRRVKTAGFAVVLTGMLLVTGCTSGSIAGFSGPAPVDDTVYAGAMVNPTEGRVFAVESATGNLRWQFPAEADKKLAVIYATPAITAGVVYIGDYDNKLYALDAANGRRNGNSPPVVRS